MTVLDNTRLSAPTSDTGRAVGIFSLIFAHIAAWNDVRATRKALHALTDSQLEDIGLSRVDIDYMAR